MATGIVNTLFGAVQELAFLDNTTNTMRQYITVAQKEMG